MSLGLIAWSLGRLGIGRLIFRGRLGITSGSLGRGLETVSKYVEVVWSSNGAFQRTVSMVSGSGGMPLVVVSGLTRCGFWIVWEPVVVGKVSGWCRERSGLMRYPFENL